MVASSTLRIINVATMARTQVTATAMIWEIRTGPPSSNPRGLPSVNAPWRGFNNTGKQGAQRAAYAVHAENVERIVITEQGFDLCAGQEAQHAHGHAHYERRHGVTKPEAGVMHTRPATTPEHVPRTVGLPRKIHSMPAHVKPAAAAAKCVAQMRWLPVRWRPVRCRS